MSKAEEAPLSVRIKCRMLGHDWVYLREKGRRRCTRCTVEEPYSVDETHEDEGAEKGAYRFKIRKGNLEIQQYQATAWGDDSEYWQWFPVGQAPVDGANLTELKEDIERYVEEECKQEGESNE